MTKLEYGDGRIKTQNGKIGDLRCIALKRMDQPVAIGATSTIIGGEQAQNDYDVILTFKTLASARLLADMINELVCEWAREESPKVEL